MRSQTTSSVSQITLLNSLMKLNTLLNFLSQNTQNKIRMMIMIEFLYIGTL